jgi:hypothetical protein
MAEYCQAECHLFWMSLKLIVTNKPFIMSVDMLSVVALNILQLKVNSKDDDKVFH